MNFLLVKPGNQPILYGETHKFNSPAIEPPFWPLLHGSYLQQLGQEVKIIDLEIEPREKLTVELINQPDYIVIYMSGHNPTASIMNMVGIDELIKQIRSFHERAVILLHGLYPSSDSLRILEKHRGIDYVIKQEGFISLDYSNTRRPQGLTIDHLPLINWDLIDLSRYRAHNWHLFGNIHNRSPYGIVYSSFGCPFSCDFCCINVMHDRVQLRDMNLVLQDIKNLYDRGVRNIKFHDELFVMDKKRVMDLCVKIIEHNMGDINAWAYARTDSLDSELIKIMLEAGIRWLGIGYESGSQAILNSSDKKQNLQKAYKVTELCKKHGMNINGNFMFGLIDDTIETMETTLKLSLGLLPEWANFNVVHAFPGTKLYEKVKKEPWFNEPKLYEEYTQHGFHCTPMGSKYLTPKEVLQFKDEAFRRFYKNPVYLNMVETKFGTETKEYIQNTLIYYPKRKIVEV
jgi:radical SAM superfamily enzyme YgiQ (UPF0313 family)